MFPQYLMDTHRQSRCYASLMIPALAIILCFQLAGEATTKALNLPLPGPVVGLVMLVAAGSLWPRIITFLRPTATGLLANLSLFFVPAGVGIVAHLGQFRHDAIGIAVALILSTVLAIAAGALVFTWIAKLTGDKGDG